ncbi:hypothetical protein EGW08_002249 [Elysia chlorotica]|uniref:Ionotropic glutamate receptor C-terminal domain-containing protein n=1 Tax=Elysia chlorotica TaxID=188477 RepID=A0A3S0ZZL1_ELYCH|nr:hypothetical protein EGW08_002249 [Elysia chlorotica]
MANLLTVLCVNYCSIAPSHARERQEKQDWRSIGTAPVWTSPEDEQVPPDTGVISTAGLVTWDSLMSVARDAFHCMTCHDSSRENTNNSPRALPRNFIFIYSHEISRSVFVSGFERSLTCPGWEAKVATWTLDVFCPREDILKILNASLEVEADTRSVVLASSHVDCICQVLALVTTQAQFKWRRLLHATEWIVITNDFTDSIVCANGLPDFVTVISTNSSNQNNYVEIMQKSRTQSLRKVEHVPLYLDNPVPHGDVATNFTLSDLPMTSRIASFKQSMNQTIQFRYMRSDAVLYLSTQKSVMAGMRIPAVLVPSEQDRTAFLANPDVNSSWVGFNVDLMNLLSEALDFTALPFTVQDDGFYGVVESNGDILGVTGYLARREAALCPMAMVSSPLRMTAMDFLYPHITHHSLYIIYRTQQSASQLGDVRAELMDSRDGLAFTLIGPGVAMTAGLVVFLVSGVFWTNNNILDRRNLRRLYNFPHVWVFQSLQDFPHQSGRILRASWALFCVAIFASYGAGLTSHACAPTSRPRISNLKDLLEQREFKLGISMDTSYFIASLRQAKAGTDQARLWTALCELNKTEPRTFSTDKAYHIRRVLAGKYAFIGYAPNTLQQNYVESDFSQVKLVHLSYRNSSMTIPTNAFYKRDMERALALATETGVIDAISSRWIPEKRMLGHSLERKKKMQVGVSHLEMLLCFMLSGLGAASFTLITETLVGVGERFLRN